MTVTTTLDDLKAPIIVIFKQIVANKIKMGDKGRALFLFKNTSLGNDVTYQLNTYKSAVFDLSDATLKKYIQQLFKGGCNQVHVLQYKTTVASVSEQIDNLLPNFDWIMSVDSDAQTDIISYAKENKKFIFFGLAARAELLNFGPLTNTAKTFKRALHMFH